MKNEQILNNLEILKRDKESIQNTWSIIEKFVSPMKEQFYTDSSAGDSGFLWRDREIYDTTALVSAQTLASFIHGNLTSTKNKWFDFQPKGQDSYENLNDASKDWIQEVNDTLWNAITESNFDSEIPMVYDSTVLYGIGGIYTEIDDEGGLSFRSYGVQEIYWDEDYNGKILNFYREYSLTKIQIISQFQNDTPEIVKECEDYQEKFKIVKCVYKNDLYDSKKHDLSKMLSSANYPYKCVFIFKDNAEQIGKATGYMTQPFALSKWSQVSGSKYAVSPSMSVLANIQSVQELSKLVLDAEEHNIYPSMIATRRGMFANPSSSISLKAGAVNIVQDVNAIKPLHIGSVSNGLQVLGFYQESIKDAYFMNRIALKDSPAMTATEVNARVDLTNKMLGGAVTRIMDDILRPVLTNVLVNFLRVGKIKPIPKDLLIGNTLDLTPKFLSSLAQVEKLQNVVAMERFVQFVVNMGSVDPEIIETIDADEITRIVSEDLGINPKAMKSKEEVQSQKQKKEQLAQQQQQADIMNTMAQGSESLSNSLNKGVQQ